MIYSTNHLFHNLEASSQKQEELSVYLKRYFLTKIPPAKSSSIPIGIPLEDCTVLQLKIQ